MPLFLWLASFFGSIFASIVAFFLQFMTKKIAIIAAVVAAISSLTIAFFAALVALISQLSQSMPEFVVTGASMILPANFPLVVSIMLTARVIRWVYEWNVKVIQLRLS